MVLAASSSYPAEMDADALTALLATLQVLQPELTRPAFARLTVIFAGWILTDGPHAVTQALVFTGVAERRHHEGYHRFFSRGTWSPDALGRLVFVALKELVGDAPLRVAIDDTLCTHKGPEVFGLGSHIDPVRSTRRHRSFAFGHVWVVLAVLVKVPFSSRTWALPVLLRLYRNEADSRRRGEVHRKKTQLAREMVDLLLDWHPGRLVVCADSAYSCDTVLRGLPERAVFVGAMRPDAVLTRAPKIRRRARKTGRPLTRGIAVPKPEQILRSSRFPWSTATLTLYRRVQTVRFKTVRAQWYRATAARELLIVIVEVTGGKIPCRVFFSTDVSFTPVQVIESYERRWAIEVTFRDLKQLLGFGQSQARKREAVLRTTPMMGLSFSLLVVWYARGIHRRPIAAFPVRPWYFWKREHAFADVLRAARRTLRNVDVLDPRPITEDLRPPTSAPSRATRGIATAKRAA